MSKGAVYTQGDIVAELERRLDAGIYTSGFPVGADLAAEFGVNIKTINKAITPIPINCPRILETSSMFKAFTNNQAT